MTEAKMGVGSLINNRYQIQDILGQGGFGRTYLATDLERFDELCVLKEFVPANTKRYAVQKARELFEREARILYRINHPQIPKFLAWFEYSESLFIVQEYIHGKTYFMLLKERLSQQRQPFSQGEVNQWLQHLLPVLDYLHANDIFHRDISPDNIMLPDGQLQPVLIDFGLVKQRVSQIWEITSSNTAPVPQASFVGKSGYSPPEQIRMGQCYPCSDLYSLAVTAIVLLTGREPEMLMNRSLEWQWRSHANIDDWLAEILDKMLAEKPGDRYQSAAEVLALLQPNPADLSSPRSSLILKIEIDETDKNLQIAEIEETDYFKQLQAEADRLRYDIDPDTEAPSFSEDPLATQASAALEGDDFEFFQFDAQPAPSALQSDVAFLERCQQALSQYIGVMAACILEDTIADHPEFSREQFIEALAAEIPQPHQAAEFKRSVALELVKPVSMLSLAATEKTESTVFEASPPDIQPEFSVQWDSSFLSHCQQVLSRYIGVMAKCVLEDMIADNPSFSREQLIAALAAEIPSPLQATEFKKRIASELEAVSTREITPLKSIYSNQKAGNQAPETTLKSGFHSQSEPTSQLTQAVADRCQQELTRCIGPMAKYIVEDALDQNPQLSVPQLIDLLAAEIPNSQQASEFRQRLLLSLRT